MSERHLYKVCVPKHCFIWSVFPVGLFVATIVVKASPPAMDWTGDQSCSSLEIDYLSDVTVTEDEEGPLELNHPDDLEQSVACDEGDFEDPRDIAEAREIARAFAPVVNAGMGWIYLRSCWLFQHALGESRYKMVARTRSRLERFVQGCMLGKMCCVIVIACLQV